MLDADPDRDLVVAAFREADPEGKRVGRVIRETFDQLYNGQKTGRYRWEQLFKTEKTHCGTLLEINLRREFEDVIEDGTGLDYRVAGLDIDCKYSQTLGGWMLPPESFGHLLLVATANDARGTFDIGVVRATDENRRLSANRDGKTSLNKRGTAQVDWIHRGAVLPPNILIDLDQETREAVLAPSSGQARVNELLRRVTGRRIGRNTIATLARQADYMARIRDNGHGARTVLRREGYLVPGGDFKAHQSVARQLGIEVPEPGEIVSVRVVPANPSDAWAVELDGEMWRAAQDDEPTTVEAPRLPTVKK